MYVLFYNSYVLVAYFFLSVCFTYILQFIYGPLFKWIWRNSSVDIPLFVYVWIYVIIVAIRKYNKEATDLQSIIWSETRRLYVEWKESRVWDRQIFVQILILLITSYLTVDKLLNLFKPISLLQNGFNGTYSIVFPDGRTERTCIASNKLSWTA